MGNENFWDSGMWIIPIVMMLLMFFVFPRIFGRGCGSKPTSFHSSDGNHKDSESQETAFDILKKRFAKGEITKEEFEQMKKTLGE